MRVLLFLAVAVATAFANNSYVVIAPSKIRANMDLALSVNILNATGEVTVTASVLIGTNVIASATSVFLPHVAGQLTIKTPENLPNAAYTLRVEGSGGLTFNSSTTLAYNSKELSIFIQSDKAIYKPGDSVNFRTFAVYANLLSYTGLIDISVFDAQGNRIKQWLQEKPVEGVITKQLTLSAQPVLGDWKIHVETPEGNAEKVVTVQEYVLPKFDVDVIMPSYGLTSDSDVTFTVKAKYTYGKPVKGTADVTVTLVSSTSPNDLAKAQPVSSFKVQVDSEAKVVLPLTDVSRVQSSLNGKILVATANVSESLTGNVMSGNGTVKLYEKGVTLEFPKTNPNTFKPGLKYIAYLKVSQPDGQPIGASVEKVKVSPSVVIELPGSSSNIYFPKPTETRNLAQSQYDLPDNGLVAIPIDLPSDAKSATITASFQGVSTSLSLGKSHSPSNSYLQLSLLTTSSLQAGQPITFNIKATQPVNMAFYQILSRGAIVSSGDLNFNNQTEHSFSFLTNSNMAPNARIVVYYVRADGEIVTDSISFDIAGAFKNKVSISVNTTDAEPGDNIKVTVQADPSSTAHLLAIDQSVLLLKSGNDVTADDVYNDLKAYDTIDSVHDTILPLFDCPACKRRKRFIWWPFPKFYGGNDATQIFENAGVKVITDALVYRYQEPIHWEWLRPVMAEAASGGGGGGIRVPPQIIPNNNNNAAELKEPTRTRANFVETWLWSDVAVGTNGTASVTAQVPDTITSWVASAFAVNSVTGLGVAPTQAHLRVFRPFFVSLNLPYSVTRGEQLVLQAIVFNYMQDDLQVRVTLAKSNSFFNIIVNTNGQEELRQEDEVQDIVVAAGDAKSVYFPIVPSDLGKIDVEVKAQSTKAADAVRRQLLVEAEGVPKEYNIPMLIDLTEGKTSFTEVVSLKLPPNTVKGSELVRVSAVGDMMGPTISGLDSLLQMPTGCGEQTMLGLAPDVYVTDYLKSVNQLTGDIKSKALSFMESGYQRELAYKHKDGSFSAFGQSDDSGSMWLTAFVTRVFHQAKAHIYIDDSIIITALQWMISKQKSDGSFPEPGVIVHKTMQGNAGNGTALTLFVLISLLENHDLLVNTNAAGVMLDEAAAKALAYAEKQVANTDDLYVLALAAYAFQLAKSSQAQAVLTKLEQKATVKDGSTYWHQPQPAKTNIQSWESPIPTQAVDTEITSYILLAYSARGDLVKAKNIIPWITKQRNPHGGFQSTQDTVVALFAMSQFAKQVYSNNFNVHVTAALSPSQSFTFNIDKTNSLLLQSRETKTVPTEVKVDATGSGMALVQVAVFFNVESEIEEVTFELKVRLIRETINELTVETCTKWLGDGPSSGMAVQEIGIPSGFDVDPESITQLPILKRTETENKKVILYFDQIGTTPVCLNFVAVRTGLVAKSQPAAIRVYDYYAPHNQVTAFYQSQILKDSSVCDVCKECGQCQ